MIFMIIGNVIFLGFVIVLASGVSNLCKRLDELEKRIDDIMDEQVKNHINENTKE